MSLTVRFPVTLIKTVAVLFFQADCRVETRRRFSTDVERMFSTDFSLVEHKSGESSKMDLKPAISSSLKSYNRCFHLHVLWTPLV